LEIGDDFIDRGVDVVKVSFAGSWVSWAESLEELIFENGENDRWVGALSWESETSVNSVSDLLD